MQTNIISTLVLAFCALIPLSAAMAADTNTPPQPLSFGPSTQLLVVTTKDWDAVAGVLRRFTKTDSDTNWTEVGTAIPVVVGRNGLGWGRGANTFVDVPGPVKKEGDGKSPAGIFRLSSAFGFAEPEKMKDIKLPYHQLTDTIECVDDVKSTNYNSIVDRSQFQKADWDSSEKMRAVGDPYCLGIVVDHNANPRRQGLGSCIFIHIWKSPVTGTSGCTAMAPDQIETVLKWLDPADNPLLIQMPESSFVYMRTNLNLPKLP